MVAIKRELPALLPRKRIRGSRAKFAKTVEHHIGGKIEPDSDSDGDDSTYAPEIDATNASESATSHIPLIKPELTAETIASRKLPVLDPKAEIAEIEALVPPRAARSGEPPMWRFILERVREMRSLVEAPVDTMGCERVGNNGGPAPPEVVRFQHLVALMLSSQTKDQVTAGAVSRLRAALKPGLTPAAVLATPEPDIERLIHPVGFFRRKAKYLKEAASICLEKYGGDIPQTIEEITEIPGVGPKMGYLLLQAAWQKVDGIGVDVHVHRLANLWRWVPESTHPTPEKTRAALEKWLPRELWAEINPLLVGFGQTWCPPRQSVKSCQKCMLSSVCPASLTSSS